MKGIERRGWRDVRCEMWMGWVTQGHCISCWLRYSKSNEILQKCLRKI